MPTQITSAGVTFTDTTTLTSADGVPSALKLTTARTINGVSFDGTGNITIPATSISGANVAKAWVNFNGTTSPGTIRSSFNVSSVTKNATGDYTITFTTPMAGANYSVVVSSNNNAASITASRAEPMADCIINLSTSSFGYNHREGAGGALFDVGQSMITVFGN